MKPKKLAKLAIKELAKERFIRKVLATEIAFLENALWSAERALVYKEELIKEYKDGQSRL